MSPCARSPPLESISGLADRLAARESEMGRPGRILLRYSGTENLARVMVEGEDRSRIESRGRGAVGIIRKAIGCVTDVKGVGVDLAQIPRLRRVVERWDDRFLRRVFTDDGDRLLPAPARSHSPPCGALRGQGGDAQGAGHRAQHGRELARARGAPRARPGAHHGAERSDAGRSPAPKAPRACCSR